MGPPSTPMSSASGFSDRGFPGIPSTYWLWYVEQREDSECESDLTLGTYILRMVLKLCGIVCFGKTATHLVCDDVGSRFLPMLREQGRAGVGKRPPGI